MNKKKVIMLTLVLILSAIIIVATIFVGSKSYKRLSSEIGWPKETRIKVHKVCLDRIKGNMDLNKYNIDPTKYCECLVNDMALFDSTDIRTKLDSVDENSDYLGVFSAFLNSPDGEEAKRYCAEASRS